ncbi:hypothetical protein LAG90_11095 [Marinilongibacter aquaticus]|uniref:hypothetical protein n=1 Tax=Marinilongibacter aquaticus TaxID=2975157 RepID=UPI0021BD9AF3|nr:hypothetical protein [Marinilongibacter aquaticus]UBM57364.1 hypothetical protein LAG90_11095 [Marinilongibacter aquaticus]
MELSHVVSDGILFLMGLYVFFQYLSKFELWQMILWEAFILSVSAAALCGALGFAGIDLARNASDFFAVLASTVGVLSLVFLSWRIALGRIPHIVDVWIVLAIGFIVFAFQEYSGGFMPSKYLPLFGMPVIFIAGLVAMFQKKLAFGLWLDIAVCLAALATFRNSFIANSNDALDSYHYLMAASLLCFGLSASKVSD